MWGKLYWALRYWAKRYWGGGGGTPVVTPTANINDLEYAVYQDRSGPVITILTASGSPAGALPPTFQDRLYKSFVADSGGQMTFRGRFTV